MYRFLTHVHVEGVGEELTVQSVHQGKVANMGHVQSQANAIVMKTLQVCLVSFGSNN